MKRILYGLLFIVCSQCNTWAVEAVFTTEDLVINSKKLDETRNLVVYLPAGYSKSDAHYPVLYVTDGDIQGPHTAGTLDYLAKFDQAPQMIVVGIVTPRETRERDLTLTSADKQDPEQLANADLFLAFVEQEVIPEVKARYRTLDYQGLAGTSHGGQFAINALVKRPGLFNGVVAVSPSLYGNKRQLLTLTETALKQGSLQGRLYISIAQEEPTMTEPFANFVALTKYYPNQQLAVISQTFSNETHNTTALLGQYYGVKYLFDGWAIPETPQTLADLQAIFATRSSLLKTALIIPEDRAAGYGQWLQYLNRQDDALTMLQWNRETYPQSLNAHLLLIKAYLHFDMENKAHQALSEAMKSIKGLSTEQKAQLESLFL